MEAKTERPSVKHSASTTDGYRIILDRARSHMTTELTDDKLDGFCRKHGYSRRQVQRALAWFDTSWRNMLVRERIRLGAGLLRDTDLTIKEVAIKAGYKQTAHFTKAFKRECGVSPAQYRKDQRNK